MSAIENNDFLPLAAPDGYAPVPLCADKSAPIALCVLAARDKNPPLILLRQQIDAQVFLGCVADHQARVLQWVELWVQSTRNNLSLPAGRSASLNNAILDENFSRNVAAALDGENFRAVATGWESSHPLPMWIDRKTLTCVSPIDPGSSEPWQLCTDEELLAAQKRPGYRATLCRHLHAANTFIEIDRDGDWQKHITSSSPDLIPLNPDGALMAARSYSPLSIESYLDLLSGIPEEEVRQNHPVAGLFANLSRQRTTCDWLIAGGKRANLLEVLHLKLRALLECAVSLRHMVGETQRPFLNISADSFRTELPGGHTGLPRFWNARSSLVIPGCAVEVPVKQTNSKYYLPAHDFRPSIYSAPATQSLGVRGSADVRLRRILSSASGRVVIEGTLATHSLGRVGPSSLLWMRLPLDYPLDIYATLEAQTALAAGEYRFRTIEQTVPAQLGDSITRAEGRAMIDVPFDVLPALSTPCDVYSLAVLAIRALLVNSDTTLAVAMDETISLARSLAANPDPKKNLPDRVAAIIAGDPRWLEALGPHRLLSHRVDAHEALAHITPNLWWNVLGVIAAMFPAMGPDSYCADYNSVASGGLERAFDASLADLDRLLVRSRSLVVSSWLHHREIRNILSAHAAG